MKSRSLILWCVKDFVESHAAKYGEGGNFVRRVGEKDGFVFLVKVGWFATAAAKKRGDCVAGEFQRGSLVSVFGTWSNGGGTLWWFTSSYLKRLVRAG